MRQIKYAWPILEWCGSKLNICESRLKSYKLNMHGPKLKWDKLNMHGPKLKWVQLN